MKILALFAISVGVAFAQPSPPPPNPVVIGAPTIGQACTAPIPFYADLTNGVLAICNGGVWTNPANGGGGGGGIPPGTTNQLLYYAASGTTLTPLNLGANLSITAGTLNAAGGGGGGGTFPTPGYEPVVTAVNTLTATLPPVNCSGISGVDPTGATSSTAGLAACAALAGNNSSVIWPPGTYQLATTYTISQTNLHVIADGAIALCTMSDGSNCIAVTANPGVTISGLLCKPGAQNAGACIYDNGFSLTLDRLGAIANSSNYFYYVVQVQNDQAFKMDKPFINAAVLRCDSTFCGSLVYNPAGQPAVGWLTSANLDPECQGNSIDWEGGNELHVSGGIVQAYSEWGVKIVNGSFWGTGDFHNEAGGCTNPLGNIGKAGFLNISANLSTGSGELGGVPPIFTPTNTGTIHYAYYIYPHNTTAGYGAPLPLSMVTNGPAVISTAAQIPLSWITAGVTGSSTLATDYDILRVPVQHVATAGYTSGLSCLGTGSQYINFSGGQSGGAPATGYFGVLHGVITGFTLVYGGQAYYAAPTTGTLTYATGSAVCTISTLLMTSTIAFASGDILVPTMPGNWLVANISQSGGAGTVQTYTDAVTTTTSYTPSTCCYVPELTFWGGSVILSTHDANLFDIGNYYGPAGEGASFIESNWNGPCKISFTTGGVLSYGNNTVLSSAFAPCSSTSTQAYNPLQALMLPGAEQTLSTYLTGVINFEQEGTNNGPTDILTFNDTSYATTVANPGNRRPASIGDTAIGVDTASGNGLALRAGSSIRWYINNFPDSINYAAQLNSSGFTITTPLVLTDGFTCTGTGCPGSSGGSVTSFSAGNFSPFFTTAVASATTTPALTFSPTNWSSNTLPANVTGGSAALSATPITGGSTSIQSSLPAGSATCTPNTAAGVSSCTHPTYALFNTSGQVNIAGGTATTGVFATINFSTTLPVAPFCLVNEVYAGAATHYVYHTPATTSGFMMASYGSISGASFNVDYECRPTQ